MTTLHLHPYVVIMAEIRLQKIIRSAGVASRRKGEALIADGRVKVNGKVVTELGTRVTPGVDQVQVDGMMVSYDPRSVYLLLYKPTRVISSVADPDGREVVTDQNGRASCRECAQ